MCVRVCVCRQSFPPVWVSLATLVESAAVARSTRSAAVAHSTRSADVWLQIIKIRATTEKIPISDESLTRLSEIGVSTTLRCAVYVAQSIDELCLIRCSF